MNNLKQINFYLGWTLIIILSIVQSIITITTFEMGRMAPFLALLSAIIILPFIMAGIASVLDRERHPNKIKWGIRVGVFFQIALPVLLPIYFDKEFIYLSLVGVVLLFVMWFVRSKIEIQLLILNSLGALLLFFLVMHLCLN